MRPPLGSAHEDLYCHKQESVQVKLSLTVNIIKLRPRRVNVYIIFYTYYWQSLLEWKVILQNTGVLNRR